VLDLALGLIGWLAARRSSPGRAAEMAFAAGADAGQGDVGARPVSAST
jgi:hypothetical protein